MVFLQRFCNFGSAERGEMGGTTWWSCGESVVESDGKLIREKHANFSAHLLNFFATSAGRISQ
jgi:hypothetical protein